MPPISTQPSGSSGSTGSNGLPISASVSASASASTSLSPRYRPDPTNTRVLLRSLEDLRDSLSNRVEQLSVAVDRLRSQAGELERAAAQGTALSPHFSSATSALSAITPLPRPDFARMSTPRSEQASASPSYSSTHAGHGGGRSGGGHGYATRLAYIPTQYKSETERSQGRPPTNLAAIAKQPKPIVVRSPRPAVESSSSDSIAYSPLPVEPPSEAPAPSRAGSRSVRPSRHRTPSHPASAEPPTRPIVTRTVSESTRTETILPRRAELYAAYQSGLTSRGMMVRERQSHSADREARDLAAQDLRARTTVTPPLSTLPSGPPPPSFSRDLGTSRRYAYVRTLDHEIESAVAGLNETRAAWLRGARGGADNLAAIMQRHVDIAHHLWDLVTQQAANHDGEDLPIDAMQNALSHARPFRQRALNWTEDVQERLSDTERSFLNRIINTPAGRPLGSEHSYYREFLFENGRRHRSAGEEEEGNTWPADRLELLDLVSRSRAHVQGVTRALSPDWWEEQAREMEEEQERENRDSDDGEETDEDESPFFTWYQSRPREGERDTPSRIERQRQQAEQGRRILQQQRERMDAQADATEQQQQRHAYQLQLQQTQLRQQQAQREALERMRMQLPQRPASREPESSTSPSYIVREYQRMLEERGSERSRDEDFRRRMLRQTEQLARDALARLRVEDQPGYVPGRGREAAQVAPERERGRASDELQATSSTISLIEQSRAHAHAMTRELEPGLLGEERPGLRRVLENLERMLSSGRHSEDIRRRLEALAARERQVLAEIDHLVPEERERRRGSSTGSGSVFDRIQATEARVQDLGRTSRRLASQRAELSAWASFLPPPSNAATSGSGRRLSDATIVPPEDLRPPSRSSGSSAERIPIPAGARARLTPPRVSGPSGPSSPSDEIDPDGAFRNVPLLPPALTPSEPSFPNTPDAGQRDDVFLVEIPREIDLADVYASEEEKDDDEDDAQLAAHDWPAAPAQTQRRHRPYVSILDL